MHTPKRQWNLNFNLYFGSSGWIKGMAYSCRFWLSNIKFTILNNQFENKFLCRITARQEINTARYNRQNYIILLRQCMTKPLWNVQIARK